MESIEKLLERIKEFLKTVPIGAVGRFNCVFLLNPTSSVQAEYGYEVAKPPKKNPVQKTCFFREKIPKARGINERYLTARPDQQQ